MNIIERNYFRLLRAGAFDSWEDIEPMSAWKWRQVLVLAERTGLTALLLDGVETCQDQFFMQLTDALRAEWTEKARAQCRQYDEAAAKVAALLAAQSRQQWRPILMEPWTTSCLYPRPSRHRVCPVTIFFPYSTQGAKADEWALAQDATADATHKYVLRYEWQGLDVEHRQRMMLLNNKLNNSTLQDIIEKERLEGGTTHADIGGQRVETVAPTLGMLMAILGIIKASLSEGLCLWKFVDMGMLLRRQGDRVDFVKLQDWIEALHFERMAQFIGSVLTGLLGFTTDEVPFMRASGASADALATEALQEDGERSAARYIRFCPGESISSVVASITHSLGNVEE
jgi:hypothetical protein